MLKRIFLLVLTFVSIQVSAQTALIKGLINGNNDFKSVEVNLFDGNQVTSVGKAIITDNTFNITAEVKTAEFYILAFQTETSGKQQIILTLHPNDNINLSLNCDSSSLWVESASGSKDMDLLKTYQDMVRSTLPLLQQTQKKYKEATTAEAKVTIKKNYDAEYQTFQRNLQLFLIQNSSMLSSAVIAYLEYGPSFETHKSLFVKISQSLTPSYPENQVLKEINAKLNNPIEIGKIPPSIVIPNAEGKLIELSSLKGKVVLVDFWASWCRPCRMENPNLVNAYAKYHAKGFEIFSVSLDNNKTNWLNAIAEDKLAWENHGSNLQGWRCPIVKEYNISTIPSSVLIDKEGKMIGINLRGQDLENALANVFK